MQGTKVPLLPMEEACCILLTLKYLFYVTLNLLKQLFERQTALSSTPLQYLIKSKILHIPHFSLV